jgi:hypothetical protein
MPLAASRRCSGRRDAPEEDDAETALKCDDSLKSFIFTLEEAGKPAARKLALKPDAKKVAILCLCFFGPTFGTDIAELPPALVDGLLDPGEDANACYARRAPRAYADEAGAGIGEQSHIKVADVEVWEISEQRLRR